MKNVSILVLEDAILASIVGPYKLLNDVNDFLVGSGQSKLFNVKLVGIKSETTLNKGLFSIRPEILIDEIDKTDLVIIPALQPPAEENDLKKSIEKNKDYIPWLIQQYENGSELASLCVGAFLLAKTGLLKGVKCSTHWLVMDEFRKTFPEINLVADKIITDEKGIYTSGGAFSFLNLILYIIEKYAGKEIAVLTSKVFEIDIDRENQSQFMIFRGQKDHEDEDVKKVQEFIESNYQEKITVNQIANLHAISKRSLERRFKKATSNSISEYMQRVKIEVAKTSLESSKENINEIMYKTGYSDIKAFRTSFKKITGLSPVQYRNKYNRI